MNELWQMTQQELLDAYDEAASNNDISLACRIISEYESRGYDMEDDE
jgi:hypothetical protein